jgi:hypothetical protein
MMNLLNMRLLLYAVHTQYTGRSSTSQNSSMYSLCSVQVLSLVKRLSDHGFHLLLLGARMVLGFGGLNGQSALRPSLYSSFKTFKLVRLDHSPLLIGVQGCEDSNLLVNFSIFRMSKLVGSWMSSCLYMSRKLCLVNYLHHIIIFLQIPTCHFLLYIVLFWERM